MDLLASPTTALARLALDAASLRHLAIASNIANAGSPGHVPQRVNFEQQLGLVRQQMAGGGAVQASSLRGVQPYLETDAASAGNGGTGALDTQMVQLAENTLQYQALLRALSRNGGILAMAIHEGKA